MMRKSWLIFVLGSVLLAGCASHDSELLGDPEPAREDSEEREWDAAEEPGSWAPADSLEMFADLRFYGSWYQLDPFGWVWRPIVVHEWAPMSEGHWVWTSYGWMWVSYDPFGWATYNYGYWVNDFMLGWVWIPDYLWAPVRCEWIGWDDYVGWSPLPPPGVRYKDPWVGGDYDPCVVVPATKFKDTQVGRHKTTQPKFKSGYSERSLRREPPDAGAMERTIGHSIKVTDVQLNPSIVGNREFTRVVLPPSEQQVVDKRLAEGRPAFKGAEPPPPSNGSDNGKVEDNTPKSKSKSTPPPPPAQKESPPRKFKEKGKDGDQSKDGEKKKG